MDDSACYHSAWTFDARVDVKQSMTLSIVCAVILCVVFQHRSAANYPDHADRIQGRGSGGCADDQWRWPAIDEEGFDDCLYDIYLFGIFSGTGMLDSITEYVKQSLKETGRFLCIVLLSVVTRYGRLQSDNRDHDDRATGLCFFGIKNKKIRREQLIWKRFCRFDFGTYSVVHCGAISAGKLLIGHSVYCLAAACYLYLIPICRLVRKKNIFPGCNN